MFTKPLPRFVIAKPLASGATAFYFNVPTLYRRLGCGIPNEALGTDYVIACGDNGDGGRAAALNALFEEWNTKRKAAKSVLDGSLRMEQWIGCSANTSRTGHISTRCRHAHGLTTNELCC